MVRGAKLGGHYRSESLVIVNYVTPLERGYIEADRLSQTHSVYSLRRVKAGKTSFLRFHSHSMC